MVIDSLAMQRSGAGSRRMRIRETLQTEKWLSVRKEIDKAYAWGTRKEENFRHSGVDLAVKKFNNERYVQLSQDFYMENLPDLAIPEDRLRGDPKSQLSPGEMAACRASLGALQWACTQAQIQACARVNLLLTELTVDKSVMVAKEIADLIKDVKKDLMNLRLWQLPHVQHWQDWTVVTMADQAHNNRPQGGSTGGLLTCLGGPEQLAGEAGRLNPVSWRTWRLRLSRPTMVRCKQLLKVKTRPSEFAGCGANSMDVARSRTVTSWRRPATL